MADRVTWHAQRAVNGEVIAGELHILACQRHLRDLERQNTEEFPYYWDEEAAARIIDYAETLTIAEGEQMRPVKLIEEQAFDMGCIFGWKKCSNDKRRFRRAYESEARQNGKSFKNGIYGTYIGGFGGYRYGKLFTAATKKRQSRIVWEEMAKFIRSDADLSEYFVIKDYISQIRCTDTDCTIEALSKEAGLDDGFRAIFAAIDELHQQKDNSIYKALYNGTKALLETLISMITTRGFDPNSFAKEIDDYAVAVLRGLVIAEDFFADIYAPDENDSTWDIEAAKKANPLLYRNDELWKTFIQDMQTAKDMGGAEERDFIVKSLNRWSRDTTRTFIAPDILAKCLQAHKLEKHRGQTCTVGLDLSGGGDLTSFAFDFDDEQPESAYFYSHSFMPRGRLNEHIQYDVAPYDIWESHGLITVTGGETDFKNDYKFIVNELKRLKEEYDLQFAAIGIDPHNADGVIGDLEQFGCPIIVVTQSARNLNDATIDIQLQAKSGKLILDKDNELLTYSFNNAEIVMNSFGEIKIDKKDGARRRRIDPCDACVDARFVKMTLKKQEQPVDLQKSLEEYLALMGMD
jgi:phage terminase large subunit-like protein